MKQMMRAEERAFARSMARLAVCNHFLPQRIDLERQALGSAFVEGPSAMWNVDFDSRGRSPNILRLIEKTGEVVEHVGQRLAQGGRLAGEELSEYEALVEYHLYQRYRSDFERLT
ncbi:MAG TPA: sigma-54-dependent Fis family transcriptional regulator, partial [Verrucomicrobiae bacterium]